MAFAAWIGILGRRNDALAIAREPDNPHDPLVVRIEWLARKLGYLPRPANAEIAEAMDQANASRRASIASTAAPSPGSG